MFWSAGRELRGSKLTSHDSSVWANGQPFFSQLNRNSMSRRLYIEKQTTVITKVRRFRITEVRESKLRFGKPAQSLPEICTQCAGVSMMMTPDSAARIGAIGIDAICQFVEAGEIHFTEGEPRFPACLTWVMERNQATAPRRSLECGL